MKLGKITLTPPLGAISAFSLSVFACGSLFGATPKVLYVSTNDVHSVEGSDLGWGTYVTDDGKPHDAYTNLQQAVDASAGGDTIWVENNFICDTGTYSDNNGVGRLYVGKAVTLRGRSGDGRTGPVVRGHRLAPTNCPSLTACGADAVRCLVLRSGAKVIGFRLEDGATANVSNGRKGDAGGAWAYYDATLENCIITNCVGARNGGGAWGCTLVDCELVDNYGRFGGGCAECTGSGLNIHHNGSFMDGAGAYNCTLEDSTIATNLAVYSSYAHPRGAGVNTGTYTRCLIVSNATSSTASHGQNEWGGGAAQATLYDCTVTNNYAYRFGGGTTMCTVYGGRIVGNVAQVEGGADYKSQLFNVLIAGNSAGTGGGIHTSSGTNLVITANRAPFCGGAYDSKLSDSLIVSNEAYVSSSYGSGSCGGIQKGSYTNCLIACNTALGKQSAGYCSAGGAGGGATLYSCVVSNNQADARGGGVSDCTLYDCIVIGNTSYSSGGGGMWNSTAYNTLIALNEGFNNPSGSAAGGYPGSYHLYNCTIVSNGLQNATKNPLDPTGIILHNCVEFGDGKNGTPGFAEYSCYPNATEGENGNTACDPKLRTVGGKEYAATSIRCKGKGVEFDWMTDPEDVRSKDWYGDPRILGDGPDMGWVSLKKTGLMLLLR